MGCQRVFQKRFLLKSPRQICIASSWVTGAVVLFILLSICGVSCQEAAPEPTPDKWVADGIITAGEYAGNMHYEDYDIFWLSDEQHVYIGMKAKAAGWVAVGIQPEPLHRETDMVLGFVNDGQASVFDMFSTAELGPCTADSELGGSDDILEFGGKEEGGFTIIEFKRALDTSDQYDKALAEGAIKIIWAYGPDDEITKKHAVRGDGEISI